MLQRETLAKEKLLLYVAVAVAVLGAIHYFVLHWALIVEPMPLAIREPAPVLIAEAYAEGLKDGALWPYSEAHYPEFTSVYGPVYTMVTGALQVVFDMNPYTLHRLFVGLTLIGSALLCGLLVWRKANCLAALVAASWFYLIQVASITVTAGPSALAVLFYLLGIAAIIRFGSGRLGLFLAITMGFLAFLTKPYASLIIPGALIYVYLFHSPRRALMAAGLTLLATGALFLAASIWMPTYYHSVFQIHSAYATRIIDNLISQTVTFSQLNFGLLLAFFVAFPLAGYALKMRKIASLWGRSPLIEPDIGIDRLLVIVAGIVLFVSLGWHGGAYLIYYNHLLLPPLILSAFRYDYSRPLRSAFVRLVLIINLLLLVLWRPPLPEDNDVHLGLMSQLLGKRALVDPVLEPIARLFGDVEIVDNGQSEYLVYYDRYHAGDLSPRSAAWESRLVSALSDQTYELILLAPQYNREALIFNGFSSEALQRNYERTHRVEIPIYFHHFKDWRLFGRGSSEIYLFQKRGDLSKYPIEK